MLFLNLLSLWKVFFLSLPPDPQLSQASGMARVCHLCCDSFSSCPIGGSRARHQCGCSCWPTAGIKWPLPSTDVPRHGHMPFLGQNAPSCMQTTQMLFLEPPNIIHYRCTASPSSQCPFIASGSTGLLHSCDCSSRRSGMKLHCELTEGRFSLFTPGTSLLAPSAKHTCEG